MKKHEEFESTSAAHDDRIKALSDQANKLIHAGHYDAHGSAIKFYVTDKRIIMYVTDSKNCLTHDLCMSLVVCHTSIFLW